MRLNNRVQGGLDEYARRMISNANASDPVSTTAGENSGRVTSVH